MFLLRPYVDRILWRHLRNLHSNMFLLRLHVLIHTTADIYAFTFQYVSIKTPVVDIRRLRHNKFTFQYVSIKTTWSGYSEYGYERFTFQYVSIKTSATRIYTAPPTDLHSNMFLLRLRRQPTHIHLLTIYIPICFY